MTRRNDGWFHARGSKQAVSFPPLFYLFRRRFPQLRGTQGREIFVEYDVIAGADQRVHVKLAKGESAVTQRNLIAEVTMLN